MASAAAVLPPAVLDGPSSGVVCPNCGTLCAATPAQLSGDGQRRIAELESQVRILTDKASAAGTYNIDSSVAQDNKLTSPTADKLADYEDELRQLQSHASTEPNPQSSPSAAHRFSSLLTSRRSTPNLQALPAPQTPSTPPLPAPQTPTRRESDLAAALQREQSLRHQEEMLRQQAEGKLKDMSGELEDLSAQLFQQANEMVSAERKARAKLEERVEVLERRDVEKRKRLERLEGALKRIDRLRGMLAPPAG
jgi:GDP/GTP exchange factor Sec2p